LSGARQIGNELGQTGTEKPRKGSFIEERTTLPSSRPMIVVNGDLAAADRNRAALIEAGEILAVLCDRARPPASSA